MWGKEDDHLLPHDPPLPVINVVNFVEDNPLYVTDTVCSLPLLLEGRKKERGKRGRERERKEEREREGEKGKEQIYMS